MVVKLIQQRLFLGTFLPNGISIAILSNQPFQAAVLEGAIKDHVLSGKD